MKLFRKRPNAPPSAPMEAWVYEDIKEWLAYRRARKFKRAFKNVPGTTLARMDATEIQELLGKRHRKVANHLANSIQEILRREDSSVVLNEQNASQSLTSMSSEVSTLRDTPATPIEECEDKSKACKIMADQSNNDPLLMRQEENQDSEVLEVEPPNKTPPSEEGQKENNSEVPDRHDGPCSPSSKSDTCNTSQEHSRPGFQPIQEIQDNFQTERPGSLKRAFAIYSVRGAPYGDKRNSPHPHKVRMCGASFRIVCKSNEHITIGQEDVIFSGVKEKGKRTINFREFEQALEKLAELNKVHVQCIRNAVIEGSKGETKPRPQTPH